MTTPNDFIYSLLNGNTKDVEIVGPPINPYNQKSISITSNKTPSSPDDISIKNYAWSLREFKTDSIGEYPILRKDIFEANSDNIDNSIIYSDNGNLSIYNVPEKTVQVYSASISSNNPTMTRLNLDWGDSISVYSNDSLLVSNGDGFGYNSKYVDIGIETGVNTLEIYLYSYSGMKNFTINSKLGELVNGWYIPNFILPTTPSNLMVVNDYNSNKKKDPNLNIVTWDFEKQAKDGNSLGYKIYRVGPYSTGTPISSVLCTGYYVGISGFGIPNGSRKFYSVSAVYPDGETVLGDSIRATFQNKIVPPSLTGYGYYPGSGNLSGSILYYNVIARTSTNKSLWAPYEVISSNDNIVKLFYTTGSNYSYIDIYRNNGFLDYSGIIIDSPNSFRSYKVATITGIGNGVFIDSGLTNGAYVTGLDFIDFSYDKYGEVNYYADNTFRLSWGALSGATYKIYRTKFSGVFSSTSLVGETTTNSFVDSGFTYTGKPITLEHIASVENVNTYNDTVLSNRTYDYKISAYNYSYVSSPLSTGYSITAGDPYPPAAPSGINITSFNGFTTLGWLNGVEPDLEGTIIYQSGDAGFTEIARTTSNTYSKFIGYSGAPWFKLANYDTSDNVSQLTSAYRGSGTFVAENIILTSFKTLSSLDVDLELYVPSGFNTTTSAMTRMQMGAIHCPSGVYQTYTVSAPPFLGLGLERYGVPSNSIQYTTYSPDDVLGGTVGIPFNSGFGFTAIEDSSLGRYHLLNVAYYSGQVNSANLYLANRCFEGKSGAPSIAYTLVSGNTTGIFVGDWIQGQYPYGNAEYNNAVANPVIATNSGFADKQVIIYLSGTSSTNKVSFGFACSNRSGIRVGPEKYITIPSSDISPRDGFSAAMDYDGALHLFYMGSGLSPSTNKLKWYKLQYNTDSSPITILNSGNYTNNGIGGYLFQQSPSIQILGEPRCFIDETNSIYIFQKGNRSNAVVAAPFKKTIFASQMDKNGNIQVPVNSIYQLPFEFESTWGITYTPLGGLAYSWYTLGTTATSSTLFAQKNRTYNYQNGVYRRMHPLEFYNSSSLYQILQSILK